MFPFVSFGGLEIPTYPVLLFSGLILSWTLIHRRTSRLGWSSMGVITVLFLAFPAGAIGGRLLAMATEWICFGLGDGGELGGYAGMTVLGSVVGSLSFAAIAVPRLVKVPVLEFLDAVAFSFPLTVMFGRLGCLSLGCCHGSAAPTDAPAWLTISLAVYAPETAPHQLFDPDHVELLWNLPLMLVLHAAIALVSVELHYRKLQPRSSSGTTLALCLVLDAIGRVLIEAYRGGEWSLTDAGNPWRLLSSVYLAITLAGWGALWGRGHRTRPDS